MYDRLSQMPVGESDCKEPDYEKLASNTKKEIDVIRSFKDALILFINTVGTHQIRTRNDGGNSLAGLLGTVTIDLMEREKTYEVLLKRISRE